MVVVNVHGQSKMSFDVAPLGRVTDNVRVEEK